MIHTHSSLPETSRFQARDRWNDLGERERERRVWHLELLVVAHRTALSRERGHLTLSSKGERPERKEAALEAVLLVLHCDGI